MWSNFFEAGGFGMYPVAIFGFVLVAAGALYLFRPERRLVPIVVTSGALTVAAGLLGTAVGVVNTLHYLQQIAPAERLSTASLGCAESLHVLVLSLIIVVVAGLMSLGGVVRAARVA